MTKVNRLTATERFWSKTKTNPANGCLEWTASLSAGYGQVKWGSKMWRAHRVSYSRAHGPIPDGMVVRQLCHNSKCVHPAHLQAVTKRRNATERQEPTKPRTPQVRLTSQARSAVIAFDVARRSGACPWTTQRGIARVFGVAPRVISTLLRKHREQEAAKQTTAN